MQDAIKVQKEQALMGLMNTKSGRGMAERILNAQMDRELSGPSKASIISAKKGDILYEQQADGSLVERGRGADEPVDTSKADAAQARKEENEQRRADRQAEAARDQVNRDADRADRQETQAEARKGKAVDDERANAKILLDINKELGAVDEELAAQDTLLNNIREAKGAAEDYGKSAGGLAGSGGYLGAIVGNTQSVFGTKALEEFKNKTRAVAASRLRANKGVQTETDRIVEEQLSGGGFANTTSTTISALDQMEAEALQRRAVAKQKRDEFAAQQNQYKPASPLGGAIAAQKGGTAETRMKWPKK